MLICFAFNDLLTRRQSVGVGRVPGLRNWVSASLALFPKEVAREDRLCCFHVFSFTKFFRREEYEKK